MLSASDIAALMKGIAPVLRHLVEDRVRPLREENERLSSELKRLSQLGPTMKTSTVAAFARDLMPVIDQMVTDNLGPILDDVKRLQEAIARAQEDRLEYLGVWNASRSYHKNAVVTQDGSGWIAVKAVAAGVRPGVTPEYWQLAIKKGRDAR